MMADLDLADVRLFEEMAEWPVNQNTLWVIRARYEKDAKAPTISLAWSTHAATDGLLDGP